MKGSIFKYRLRNGRTLWRYQIDAGRAPDGRRIRISRAGFTRERDAVAAMQAALRELSSRGAPPVPTTLGEWLDAWLPQYAATKPLEATTTERYISLAAVAKRALGHIRLADLTTHHFDQFYAGLRGRYSPKTTREIHNVLHVALRRAVKAGLIAQNPADGADLPRLDQREPLALSPEQLARFQAAAAGTELDPLIRLAAATGLRRGELLALRWGDLDWATGRLRVERALYQTARGHVGVKPTKTRQARVVTLPPSVLEALRFHRERQQQDRDFFGPDYRTDLDLIFATPAGDFLKPDSVSWTVCDLARRAGLPKGVGLHSLRHTHASALLTAGVPIANVARRLGHRDTHTTARIYAHALPDTDAAVASLWDRFLAGDFVFGTSWHTGMGPKTAKSKKTQAEGWRPQRDSNPRCRLERAVS